MRRVGETGRGYMRRFWRRTADLEETELKVVKVREEL